MDGPAIHRETWWWNDVIKSVIKKWKLWKEWNHRNTSKERYLQEQKKARRAIYLANIKQKGKYLEALYGEMIRNVIFARFQRAWSKLIKILLVGSA